MNVFLETVAWLSFWILFYVYLGYPLLLIFLQRFFHEERTVDENFLPKVTFLISSYNESEVIREKLQNSLELDYPKDLFEIIVISDASTDGTDEIVKEFEGMGVKLLRQEKRLGKTAGLNEGVKSATGEFLLFSDANAIYEVNAVKKIVRNFSDEKIGYVVGEARYADATANSSSQSENTYWNYEILLKQNESNLHSIVGGDGAIYAIRSELYEDLRATDINDFVNPLQIVLKGYRGVYEPQAVCWEHAAGTFSGEFKRKVRIVNRSFSGLLRLKSVLNPFRTGFFSLEIISHKLLRWFSPFFILGFGFPVLLLALGGNHFYQTLSLFVVSFLGCAYVGFIKRVKNEILPFFYYPYYFISVNVAAFQGVLKSFQGNIQSTWDTARSTDSQKNNAVKDDYFWVVHLLAFILAAITLWLMKEVSTRHLSFALTGFWGSLGLMSYIYFGYPLTLYILNKYRSKQIKTGEGMPQVTLLVCAFNEEKVIEEKVKNMLSLDYPREKIGFAIASDGSDDKTNELVSQFDDPRLKLFLYEERRGKIGVINETFPQLQGEIIILSDANTIFKKDAVKKIVRNFSDPQVGGVSSDVVLENKETTYGESESAYYRYERWIQQCESNIGSIIGADGGMYAIRKELFIPPSSNIILDDFVISMNVVNQGYRLIYDREARAQEDSKTTWKEEFSRKARVIAGAVQAIKQNEGIPSLKSGLVFFCFLSHKFFRWMVPVFMVFLFFCNFRLALNTDSPFYLFSFLGQVVFYCAALTGLMREWDKSPLIKIPFYFCLVNGAALYGMYKGLFNKQPVKWTKVER